VHEPLDPRASSVRIAPEARLAAYCRSTVNRVGANVAGAKS
jgi:hypothetical protein